MPSPHVLPAVHQQSVYNLSLAPGQAPDRLMVVVVFLVLVAAAANHSDQIVAAFVSEVGAPAVGLLLVPDHRLSFALQVLYLVVSAVDAGHQVYSAVTVVNYLCHHAVKLYLTAGFHSAAVVHHARHHFVALLAAVLTGVVHQTVSAVTSLVAVTTVLVADELTRQVVVELARQVAVVDHPAVVHVTAAFAVVEVVPSLTVSAAQENVSAVTSLVAVTTVLAAAELARQVAVVDHSAVVAVTASSAVVEVALSLTVAAACVLPAGQFAAVTSPSASSVPAVALVRIVEVVKVVYVSLSTDSAVLAAVVSAQAAELLLLLFVCPAHVHVSTDPMQSVLDDHKLHADRLSPSQLSVHKFLQHLIFMHYKTTS